MTQGALHAYIVKYIIDNGFAPSNLHLSEHFEAPMEELEQTLIELSRAQGIVLHPGTASIWIVHPFSLSPTAFYVKSENGQWWGNCAWCSLGIAALLDTDVTISTRLGGEDETVKIRITNGEIEPTDLMIHFPVPMRNAWDNVIYTCSTMLVFKNQQEVDDWSSRHHIPSGDVQPIAKIWEFSKKWYGRHLSDDWKKWTDEEAADIFREFELTHEVWQLP